MLVSLEVCSPHILGEIIAGFGEGGGGISLEVGSHAES